MATRQQWATAIGGLGAGFQGKGSEWRRDQSILSKERKQALVSDFYRANQLVNAGNIDQALSLINNRGLELAKFGANTDSTDYARTLLEAGDPESLATFGQSFNQIYDAAVLEGIVPPRPAPTRDVVSPGQQVYVDGKLAYENPDAANETFRPPTEKERAMYGMDPERQYKINNLTGEPSAIGGAGTTINTGDNTPPEVWAVNKYRDMTDDLDLAAVASARRLQDVEVMNMIANAGDLNTAQAIVAEAFPSVATALNWAGGLTGVYQQLQARMIPGERPEGSGTTSDADMMLYSRGVGSLLNSPEARALSQEIYAAKAQLDQEISEVAFKIGNGEIPVGEGRALMAELRSRSLFTAGITSRIEAVSPGFFDRETSPVPEGWGGAPESWNRMTAEQQAEYMRLL